MQIKDLQHLLDQLYAMQQSGGKQYKLANTYLALEATPESIELIVQKLSNQPTI